jgi:hypothetical protein
VTDVVMGIYDAEELKNMPIFSKFIIPPPPKICTPFFIFNLAVLRAGIAQLV